MGLHEIIFYCCCSITIIVFTIQICSLFKQRSVQAPAVYFHRYIYSDLCWTLVSFAILIALAFPAAVNLFASS